ncbi:hypothetical protein BD626DRAFT_564442 [Schizophyllum amplum]|uniref:Uncharacterized protein n=1 Tax=Schizophyllum amplum TaxID=97359 RepID=A0A550CRU5_9AGAR|nr:hypothetical protein BD626DRAFT_564442 [Auriculariopsis ampla]
MVLTAISLPWGGPALLLDTASHASTHGCLDASAARREEEEEDTTLNGSDEGADHDSLFGDDVDSLLDDSGTVKEDKASLKGEEHTAGDVASSATKTRASSPEDLAFPTKIGPVVIPPHILPPQEHLKDERAPSAIPSKKRSPSPASDLAFPTKSGPVVTLPHLLPQEHFRDGRAPPATPVKDRSSLPESDNLAWPTKSEIPDLPFRPAHIQPIAPPVRPRARADRPPQPVAQAIAKQSTLAPTVPSAPIPDGLSPHTVSQVPKESARWRSKERVDRYHAGVEPERQQQQQQREAAVVNRVEHPYSRGVASGANATALPPMMPPRRQLAPPSKSNVPFPFKRASPASSTTPSGVSGPTTAGAAPGTPETTSRHGREYAAPQMTTNKSMPVQQVGHPHSRATVTRPVQQSIVVASHAQQVSTYTVAPAPMRSTLPAKVDACSRERFAQPVSHKRKAEDAGSSTSAAKKRKEEEPPRVAKAASGSRAATEATTSTRRKVVRKRSTTPPPAPAVACTPSRYGPRPSARKLTIQERHTTDVPVRDPASLKPKPEYVARDPIYKRGMQAAKEAQNPPAKKSKRKAASDVQKPARASKKARTARTDEPDARTRAEMLRNERMAVSTLIKAIGEKVREAGAEGLRAKDLRKMFPHNVETEADKFEFELAINKVAAMHENKRGYVVAKARE